MLLVAVGRAPVTEDLGLEALGIELERGYVKVNGVHADRGAATSTPSATWCNTPWLAHVASAEGILAVEHMAGQRGAAAQLRPHPVAAPTASRRWRASA